jgi:folate-binding protein YgfZ
MTDLLSSADALLSRVGLRERPDLGATRVSGDDRVEWLNGQITNDVRAIAPGASVHALSVSVRGKIQSELWVAQASSDALLFISPRSAQAALLESFERYIIMEDVSVEPLPEWRVLTIEGPESERLQTSVALPEGVVSFAFAPLGLGGHAWVGPEAALAIVREQLVSQAIEVSPEAYELARVRRARPQFGIDFDEHQYPQEAGLKDSVSFQKGCYLGQEVVCTLESRGRLSRHLCALSADDGVRLERGAAISASGQDVGTITSAVWDPALGRSRALAYVKRAHASVGTHLLAGAHTLTIERLVGEHDGELPNT